MCLLCWVTLPEHHHTPTVSVIRRHMFLSRLEPKTVDAAVPSRVLAFLRRRWFIGAHCCRSFDTQHALVRAPSAMLHCQDSHLGALSAPESPREFLKQYPDGAYSTALVRQGEIVDFESHVQRLSRYVTEALPSTLLYTRSVTMFILQKCVGDAPEW